jgi:DNA-binding response OmpR family regulator
LKYCPAASILKQLNKLARGGKHMPKHIVVIDDDHLILTMAKDFLLEAGFRVSTSDNGLFSNHIIYSSPPPDLIIIDVMMPLISGDQKIKTLKSKDRSRQIPVLLMSSKKTAELQQLADSAGADGIITKPFTPTSLVQSVRKYL